MVVHVNAEAPGDERGALLAFLDAERGGVRRALLGLTDEQAATRPSASELSRTTPSRCPTSRGSPTRSGCRCAGCCSG